MVLEMVLAVLGVQMVSIAVLIILAAQAALTAVAGAVQKEAA
jgi:hypothetical protein